MTEKIYGSKAVKLPTPHFVVFYNGKDKQPERKVMYLSNLYAKQIGEAGLELAVVQLNINKGYNEELKKSCEPLFGYMTYVEKVSRYQKEMRIEEAVDRSVAECIQEGSLPEFFQKNRAEVVQMSIFEYDEEAHMRLIREEGREEAMFLVNRLLSESRLEDLRRATKDKEYMRSLIDEFESTEEFSGC